MIYSPSSIRLFLAFFLVNFFNSCNHAPENKSSVRVGLQDSSAYIIRVLNANLTESVVDDGFSPPVASRIYAYPNIAFYETIRYLHPEMNSLSGKLNGLGQLPSPDSSSALDFRVAAIEAFSKVAVELVYRDNMIADKKNELQGICFKDGNDSTLFNNSVAFGSQVADSIIKWMSKDNYKQTRTMPKYTVLYQPGTWVPTAPGYGEAIEPHFMKVRPFTMDSSSQFKPQRPIAFSTDKKSAFYKEAYAVYAASFELRDSTIQMTRHWDCNPVPSTVIGHLKYVRRQLTPGGHWIWIAGKAAEIKNLSLSNSAEIDALTSIALMDAFISCWDEKYRSQRIRPETFIKDHIDKKWKSYLECPQFPEYTSGHSVISASASTVLTNYFGNDFAFVDSAEVEFGLAPRNFSSFKAASDEAMVSRFLGGIHYMETCVNGREQGQRVGTHVWQKTKK